MTENQAPAAPEPEPTTTAPAPSAPIEPEQADPLQNFAPYPGDVLTKEAGQPGEQRTLTEEG